MTDPSTPSEALLRTFACVLDEIIPPSADGRLPGAGEVGLGPILAALPDVAALLEPGLDAIAELAREAGHDGLLAVPLPQRRALLESSAKTQPTFLPTLVARTFIHYYQQAPVLDAIGIGAGPLFPKGFAVPATDFGILDPVRARAPFYREP